MTQRVILATISLNNMAGGLERNFLYLANHLARSGAEVQLVTFDRPEAQAFYPLEPRIVWHRVGMTSPHGSVSFSERWQLIRRIRSVLKSVPASTPIVCFHHGILARFVLARGLRRHPIVCSERNSLSLYRFNGQSKWNLNFFLLFLTRAITVQFPNYVGTYPWLLRRRIAAIPNPVFPPGEEAHPRRPGSDGRYTLLTITRLSGQKNLDLLIHAFGGLAAEFPAWDLKIVGDGDQGENLRALIASLHLSDRVLLLGKQQNVADYYRSSHLFALPSKWEGFPNALAEALAYGLPAIGYAESNGVNELIQNERNGLLAPDYGSVSSLQEALRKLMGDAHRRESYGLQAAQSVLAYDPNSVFALWDRLLAKVQEA